MKTIKYLTTVGVFLTLSLFFFSCVDDEISGKTGAGDGKSIQLAISAPENTVINPFTKAIQANSQSVTELTILIFDDEGNKIESEYINDSSLEKLGKEEGAFIARSYEVGAGATGSVCVVANAGTTLSGIQDYKELEDLRFELNLKNPGMVMFASKQNFNVNDASSKINAELIRIYSMVTVVVKDNTDKKVTITPQSLTLYNIPKTGRLIGDNLITTEKESERLGETLTVDATDPSKVWKFDSHEGGSVLYLYENKQPDGFCMTLKDGVSKDQTSKTPLSFTKAITDTQLLMGDIRSSFIEIQAGYLEEGSGVTDGKIKYRFFLGRNAYDNFDVSRNVHYKITLTLEGNGGVDEATWRVETEKLPNRLNLSDIYVSYLGGSTSELVVTGDVEGIVDAKLDLIYNPNKDDKDPGFTYSYRKNADGNYVAIVKGNSTNVHYYENKLGELVFTMRNGKKLKTNVYQVPRLVDPIAIYKKGSNEDETKIEVKKYDEDKRKYVELESVGPWEVLIDGTSEGDWFELRSIDGSQSVRPSQGKTITGEGKVQFIYDPLSQNAKPETDDDGARYGKIIVKYHNKWCVHEIFLRQGYQPTTLGKEAWSLFNCTGVDSEGKPHTTVYPTQTGWLFKGGCNFGMHPFEPGYLKKSDNGMIKYSDSDDQTYDFTRMDSELKNNLWEGKQGPCPEGYKVADAYAYESMVNNAYAYAGYVYDDDPVKGWEYGASGDAVLLTADNSCNPAKGLVFIDRNSTKNLFFGFGKGVVSGMEKVDNKLVNEIGVGHRYRGKEYQSWYDSGNWGWLTVNDCDLYGELTSGGPSYGGWYWNASAFHGKGGSHLGKVDFMYNLFSSTPFDIDVPTNSSDDGINVNSNASFVRCVVDTRTTKEVEIEAKFYWRMKDNNLMILTVSPHYQVEGGDRTQIGLDPSTGKINRPLNVPKNATDNTKVVFDVMGIKAEAEYTIGELKDPNTQVIFLLN